MRKANDQLLINSYMNQRDEMARLMRLVESAEQLDEGPIAQAIGSALLGLGLMASPGVSAGPDSGASDSAQTGTQISQTMPGYDAFQVNSTSQLDSAYEKTAWATCKTIADRIDSDFTKQLVDAGNTFYDTGSGANTTEQEPKFLIKDDGKGNGGCLFTYTTIKSANSGKVYETKIYQTRDIVLRWKNFVISAVVYTANGEGTLPSTGLAQDPSTTKPEILNLMNNPDKRVAPKKVFHLTSEVLPNTEINLDTMTKNRIAKISAR